MTAGKSAPASTVDPLRFDNRQVPPEGCREACLYLVGEAPGKKEAEAGRPFVGHVGEALRDMMREAGINFARVRLANVIPFRPIERSSHDRLRNRTPTQTELRIYGQFVLDDLLVVRPAVICALGKSAASLFGISGQIDKARKRRFEFQGMAVRVTYHPGYVVRFGGEGSQLWKSAVRDLKGSWLQAKAARP
jgi:DNA polymerase